MPRSHNTAVLADRRALKLCRAGLEVVGRRAERKARTEIIELCESAYEKTSHGSSSFFLARCTCWRRSERELARQPYRMGCRARSIPGLSVCNRLRGGRRDDSEARHGIHHAVLRRAAS